MLWECYLEGGGKSKEGDENSSDVFHNSYALRIIALLPFLNT